MALTAHQLVKIIIIYLFSLPLPPFIYFFPNLLLAEWLAGKWWVLLAIDVSMGLCEIDQGPY